MSTYASQLAAINAGSSIIRIDDELPRAASMVGSLLLRVLLLPFYPLGLAIIYILDRQISKSAVTEDDTFVPTSASHYTEAQKLLLAIDKAIAKLDELNIQDDDQSFAARKARNWRSILQVQKVQIAKSLQTLDHQAVSDDDTLAYIPEDQVWNKRSKGYAYRF